MSRLTYAVLANEWARPLDGVSRSTTFQEAKSREKEKERGEIEDALKKSSSSSIAVAAIAASTSSSPPEVMDWAIALGQLPNPSALHVGRA